MADVPARKCRLCGVIVSATSTFCSRCGAAADQNVGGDDELADQVRALFAGEIAIDREIGRGSMAVVYLGFDLELERRVAIKVLPPDIAADPEIADRFKREAKMVAALNHPNVIPIYGVRNSQSISAIVMQFVDGSSLDVVLLERSSETLPLPLAGLVLSQVAAGLEHAHTRGVVHRDVKPANVLLDSAGQVFVSDFGIARRYDGASATGSGIILGTATYMSPEQCLGRRAAAASDQYALGVMAFELLAGRLPFIGRMSALLSAHINDPPPRLSAFRPQLSPEVESFVMRMLEKDPAARHPNLREAERFFRRLVIDEHSATTQLAHVSLRKPIAASQPAGIVHAESAPGIAIAEGRAASPRRRSLLLLAAGAGVAAAAVAGALMLRTGPEPPPVVEMTPASAKSKVSPASGAVTGQSVTPPADLSPKNANGIPDRSAGEPVVAAQEKQQMVPLPTEPAVKLAADTAVRRDTAGARPQGEVQSKEVITAPSPPSVTATVADARAVASEFLTWCNHRQSRDVERLPTLEGSADLRSELIRLIRSAPDFQAGFERLASRPVLSDRTFTTDFVLDLVWRGGQRQLQVTVSAEMANGSWHLAGFGVHAPD